MNTTADLRHTARALFDQAIAKADPTAALARHLAQRPLPRATGQTIIIAIGKAAPAMMQAALVHVFGAHQALCITHHENTATCPGATILHAGHPVPDADGLAAGAAVIKLLAQAGADDQVIALISGGGSALVPAPSNGLTLDDKITLNRALLASGLDIVQMNMIRQQASELKGGGMLRHAAPAPVTSYILSDVIGDDLNAIASGPTTAPLGTRAQAADLLRRVGAWDRLTNAMRAHLSAPAPDMPNLSGKNHLIGSNGHSLRAAADAAGANFDSHIISDHLIGDVNDAARAIHTAAGDIAPDAPATALLWGGETTVRLTGTGRGGRNQELALRLAALAAQSPLPRRWLFLSGGTDGRDGPTDAAGAMVDGGTWQRITDAGGDANALLVNNDSNAALALAGDLLITQATGTNVADIQILLSVPG